MRHFAAWFLQGRFQVCSEHLSARLRISKIIRSSKQRWGLGQIPANLFDLTSHATKSVLGWEKWDMERELWKQNWGMAGFHAAVFEHGEQLNIWLGWRASCQQKSAVSADRLPTAEGNRTDLQPSCQHSSLYWCGPRLEVMAELPGDQKSRWPLSLGLCRRINLSVTSLVWYHY